jgi:hypothetical protein
MRCGRQTLSLFQSFQTFEKFKLFMPRASQLESCSLKLDRVHHYPSVAPGAPAAIRNRPPVPKRFVDSAAGAAFYQLFGNDSHVLGGKGHSGFVAALKQRFALGISLIHSDDASGRFDFIFNERALIG